MILEQYAQVAVVILVGSSLVLLLARSWRTMVIALAVQYLAMFWLVSLVWPIGMAAVKLVIGWMAGAVLGASRTSLDLEGEELSGTTGQMFRLLAAVLVMMLVFSVDHPLAQWFPASLPVIQGGLTLAGLGLLQLGMSNHPLRVVAGLLTVMAGFELLYASIETSVLVAGLLGVVNLGLALVGAYVLLSSSMEEETA